MHQTRKQTQASLNIVFITRKQTFHYPYFKWSLHKHIGNLSYLGLRIMNKILGQDIKLENTI